MRNLSFLSMALTAPVCLLCLSCVNGSYDLDKLDTRMTLFEKEGIEIPLPDVKASDFGVFNDNGILIKYLHECATGNFSELDFSEVDLQQLEEGIQVVGEYLFDLSYLPASLHNVESEIIFGDDSFFNICVDNTTGETIELSCEVYDAKNDTVIGAVKGQRLAPGLGQDLRLNLSSLDIDRIPETAVIRNVVLKAAPVKGGLFGAIRFLDADFNLNPVIIGGSRLEYDYEFKDFLKEVGIDRENLKEYVNAISFILNARLLTDLPMTLSGAVSGDFSVSIEFDGPTPDGGADISIPVSCPDGLASIKNIALHFRCTTKADIDLTNLDAYTLHIIPESIRLDKGIDVGK